jgi:putative addiction module component (TIGR02574 family)
MAQTVAEILEQADALSDADRAELLLELMLRMAPVKSDQELLTPELKAELNRRLARMDAHPEESTPMEVVHERLRAEMRARLG